MTTPLIIQPFHKSHDVFPREAYSKQLVIEIILKPDETVALLHDRLDACAQRISRLAVKLDFIEQHMDKAHDLDHKDFFAMKKRA